MTIKFHNVLFIFIFRLTKLREKYMSDVGVLAPHTKCIVCRGGLRDPVVSLQCFHTCKFSVSGVSHRNNKWFREQKSIKSRKRLDQSALKYRKFCLWGGGGLSTPFGDLTRVKLFLQKEIITKQNLVIFSSEKNLNYFTYKKITHGFQILWNLIKICYLRLNKSLPSFRIFYPHPPFKCLI